ncbi:MAG: TIGR02281 family clan AA aspartic protease [Gammaproteobacteria bacterium]|nr:TIGR02281 family clan AA aspartic protease [Gammaproteobacteria bacterium]
MSHSTRKLGSTFTWLGWIIGFLILALLFDRILDKQMNPNQSVQTVMNGSQQAIVLERNRQGHYLFNGEINGKSVTFLVDTGATTTSIPAHMANRLGLSKGQRFTVQTANGTSYAYTTLLEILKLGEISFQNIRASLNPGLTGNEILLGMNVLKQMDIIQRDNLLILKR